MRFYTISRDSRSGTAYWWAVTQLRAMLRDWTPVICGRANWRKA